MDVITSIEQLDPAQLYTYTDYLSWQIGERLELIKGEILKMAAPSNVHQEILGNFHGFIWAAFRMKTAW